MRRDIGLTEALKHDATCSVFGGGTCDCAGEFRNAEGTAPAVHEVHADGSTTCLHTGPAPAVAHKRLAECSRVDFLRVFALWDMAIAQDLKGGVIASQSANAALLVMARFVEIVADLDADLARELVPEDSRQQFLRAGLDCPTRMMRLPEEEQ